MVNVVPFRRVLMLMGLALSALVLLVGCGNADDDAGTTASAGASTGQASAPTQETEKIKIAALPIVNSAPIPIGVKEGFFADEGIELEVVDGVSAPTIYPSLLKGDLQAGTTSWAALTAAAAEDLPLVGVAAFDNAGSSSKNDYVRLVALKDSGIGAVGDLEGKTVAVNSTKNLTEVQISAIAEHAGVPRGSIKFISVPFANMAAALKSGQVDAASMAEPFVTQVAEEADVVELAGANAEFVPDLQVANVVMSRKFVDENPELVERFQRAVRKSAQYAQAHPEAVREVLPDFSGIPAELAERIKLPRYIDSVDVGQIQDVAEILHDYGVIAKVPDMQQYVLPEPSN